MVAKVLKEVKRAVKGVKRRLYFRNVVICRFPFRLHYAFFLNILALSRLLAKLLHTLRRLHSLLLYLSA